MKKFLNNVNEDLEYRNQKLEKYMIKYGLDRDEAFKMILPKSMNKLDPRSPIFDYLDRSNDDLV